MCFCNLKPLSLRPRCRLLNSTTSNRSSSRPLAFASPTATGIEKPSFEVDRRATIVADYPDAFTDTYGTVSGSPFLYKTGSRWPQPEGGPDAQPFLRKLYPVNSHRITNTWTSIVFHVEVYLDEHQVPFTAVAGFGWGNEGSREPFCPLLMTIGVKPGSVAFADAKTTADAIKSRILDKASFSDVEVAIWEWTTGFAGVGPKLSSLEPLVDEAVTDFAAPFSSILPLPIAPLKGPNYEGTASVFLRRRTGSKYPLVLTAGHVARPPLMYPANTGLMEKASREHPEEIIILGDAGFQGAITKTESRIGTLREIKAAAEDSIKRLQEHEAAGTRDPEKIANALRREQQKVMDATEDIEKLNDLDAHVVKAMFTPTKRVIGQVLHADVVGPSSGLEPFTIDWAVIELSEDAFDWDTFKGNKVYIGLYHLPILLLLRVCSSQLLSQPHRRQPRQGILQGTYVPLGS